MTQQAEHDPLCPIWSSIEYFDALGVDCDTLRKQGQGIGCECQWIIAGRREGRLAGIREERDRVIAANAVALSGTATDTQQAAAFTAYPKSGSLRRAVYDLICNHPRTDDQLEIVLGRSHQSVSARRRELVLGGFIVDSGERRKTRRGTTATVWRKATDATMDLDHRSDTDSDTRPMGNPDTTPTLYPYDHHDEIDHINTGRCHVCDPDPTPTNLACLCEDQPNRTFTYVAGYWRCSGCGYCYTRNPHYRRHLDISDRFSPR